MAAVPPAGATPVPAAPTSAPAADGGQQPGQAAVTDVDDDDSTAGGDNAVRVIHTAVPLPCSRVHMFM